MIPILLTFFGFELNIAVGAVITALIPSSIISTLFNRKKGNVDFKLGILLELPTMIGVVAGSFLLSYISPQPLKIVFALMVLILGISFFFKSKDPNKRIEFLVWLNKLKPSFLIVNEKKNLSYRISFWMINFFGLLAGSLAGIFGIGGGFLKTPIMIKIFRIPAKIAAATALFMIIITSITGTVTHYLQGHILIESALPIIFGFSLGALSGVFVNLKIDDLIVEKLVGVSSLLAGLIMLYNIFAGS